MRRILALLVLATIYAPALADAQGARRPSRPYRGLFGGGPRPDPNRTSHELTFSANVLGGYDDVISPGGLTAPDPTQPRQSGYSATGDVALQYRRGTMTRFVTVDGQAYTNAYSGVGVSPAIGGNLHIQADTGAGRSNRLQFTQDLGYQPTLVLGAFAPLSAEVQAEALPESGVSTGFLDQRSWNTASIVSVDRQWTRRYRTSVGGGFLQRRYLDNLGYDTRNLFGNASLALTMSRTTDLRASYRYDEGQLESGAGLVTPLTSQNLEMTGAYSRRLSLSRRLQLSAGGGGTHVRTLSANDRSPLAYWMPSGSGSLRVDLGRSWAVSGNYRRAVSVLQGVTLTAFATDAASVRIDGLIGRRIETAVSAAYSNGRSGGLNTTGRFASYGGSVQGRYALARCCAASLVYDYYDYRLRDIIDLPPGVPPSFDRNAVRIGFSLALPLYGTYIDRADRSGRN
jgi:hypothetical protein